MKQSEREHLLTTIALKVEKDVLQTECDALSETIETQTERVGKLENRFATLSAEVEKLDQPSIKNLFFSIKGTKEEQLAQEQKELGELQLELEKAQSELDQQQKRLLEAQAHISQIDISDYKLVEISRKNVADPEDIVLKTAVAIASNHVLDQKIEEIILLGKEAMQHLENGHHLLESASAIGTMDGFGGQGVFAHITKQNRLQQASEEIQASKKATHRFNQDLLRLNQSNVGTVHSGGLSQMTRLTWSDSMTEREIQTQIFRAIKQIQDHQFAIIDAIRKLRALQASEQTIGRALIKTWQQINSEDQTV